VEKYRPPEVSSLCPLTRKIAQALPQGNSPRRIKRAVLFSLRSACKGARVRGGTGGEGGSERDIAFVREISAGAGKLGGGFCERV